jgi:hypothetical protein
VKTASHIKQRERIIRLRPSAGWRTFSRVVVLDPSDVTVRAFNSAFHVEHGRLEVRDTNIFGLPVKHGLIITSKRAA